MACGACEACGRSLVMTHRQETVTVAHDPDLQGIGATSQGDLSGALRILQNSVDPERPTPRLPRMWYRLTDALQVQQAETVFVRGARLYATIAQATEVGEDDEAGTYVDERPIETPGWRFQDGTIAVFVRVLPGAPALTTHATPDELTPFPSVSTNPYDGPPARLVQPGGAPPGVLAQGVVPGQPVGALGTIVHLPFSWVRGGPEYSYPVRGPASIVMYAEVLQTDPLTRIAAPDDTSEVGEVPENSFVRTRPNAQYRHLVGALLWERVVSVKCRDCQICDLCCCCEDKRIRARRLLVNAPPAAPPPLPTSTMEGVK